MALIHLLETSACQQMPGSGSTNGIFPIEIYRMILFYLGDLNTYCAWVQVSRTFRILCQQNGMMDDVVFQANGTSKPYAQTSASFLPLRMKTISTGRSQDVNLRCEGVDSRSGVSEDHH